MFAAADPYALGFSHDVCEFGPLRIWAERGLIHIEDARDNSYKAEAVRTALRRVKGVQDMLANSKAELTGNGSMTVQEYERQQRMIEKMVDVCAKAQVQGMPSDQSAVRDLVRRLPMSVTVPSLKSIM